MRPPLSSGIPSVTSEASDLPFSRFEPLETRTLLSAQMQVSHTQLDIDVVQGQTAELQIDVANLGDQDLLVDLASSHSPFNYSQTIYQWLDISGSGTQVSLGDDDVTDPIDLGFDINFFGENHSTFRIGSDGWISLGNGSDMPAGFGPLPTGNGVDNMIALFWDDLDPSDPASAGIYYLQYGDNMIIQYENIVNANDPTETLSAQAIIRSNGQIILQYEEVYRWGFVGIQEDSSLGQPVQRIEYIPSDFTTVELSPYWMQVEQSDSTVSPGEDADLVKITLNTDDLSNGQHQETFTITGTDALDNTTQTVTVSVNLNVTSGSGRDFSAGVIDVTDEWTTVDMNNHFDQAVIVATPVHFEGAPPVVTRIRNVTANTFDIRLQRMDGESGPVAQQVQYFAAEEGVSSSAHGVKYEAWRFESDLTAGKGAWDQAHLRQLHSDFINPVIIGQVMSHRDHDASTFFSYGNTLSDPANGQTFHVGKHIGEDPDAIRETEEIGYIVMEAGTGSIQMDDGFYQYEIGLGDDKIRGVDNHHATYNLGITPDYAVASRTGIDGADGGWAVLSGTDTFGNKKLRLAIDEDQIADTERNHTSEQVAYIALEKLDLPVLKYDFENELMPAKDTSGFGEDNTGIIQGDVLLNSEFGTTLAINGGSVIIPDSTDINLGTHKQRTISLRFRVDSLEGRQVLYEEGGSQKGINIYLDEGVLYYGIWDFTLEGWDGTFLSHSLEEYEGDWFPEKWYHVGITLDGANELSPDAFKAYFEGDLIASGQAYKLKGHSDNIALAAVAGNTVFHDGASNTSDAFYGEMDSFQIYNRTIDEYEMRFIAERHFRVIDFPVILPWDHL